MRAEVVTAGSVPGADPGAGPGAGPRAGRHRSAVVWGCAVLLLLSVRAWGLEPLRIPSSSMAPTLHSGEHVLAEKATRHVREWRRGDVVVFANPSGDLMLKRLVGLPGDRVAIEDGLLSVNGVFIDEAYVDPETVDSVFFGPVRVDEDTVFVLGDNRADSVDSRTFGTVPVDDLEGRAIAVLWPLDEMRMLTRGGWQ